MEQDAIKLINKQAAKLAVVMDNLAASAEEVAEAQNRFNELVLKYFPPAEGAVLPSVELEVERITNK